MTDTDSAVYAKLSAVSALSGLSITPTIRPANAGADSSVVYINLNENTPKNLAQESLLNTTRYQIDCYASSRADAKTLADAIKADFDQFRGTISAQYIELILYVDGSRREDFEDDTSLYKISRQYDVFYN